MSEVRRGQCTLRCGSICRSPRTHINCFPSLFEKSLYSLGVGWIINIFDLVDLCVESGVIENPLDRFSGLCRAAVVDMKQLRS